MTLNFLQDHRGAGPLSVTEKIDVKVKMLLKLSSKFSCESKRVYMSQFAIVMQQWGVSV